MNLSKSVLAFISVVVPLSFSASCASVSSGGQKGKGDVDSLDRTKGERISAKKLSDLPQADYVYGKASKRPRESPSTSTASGSASEPVFGEIQDFEEDDRGEVGPPLGRRGAPIDAEVQNAGEAIIAGSASEPSFDSPFIEQDRSPFETLAEQGDLSVPAMLPEETCTEAIQKFKTTLRAGNLRALDKPTLFGRLIVSLDKNERAFMMLLPVGSISSEGWDVSQGNLSQCVEDGIYYDVISGIN